jgi:hypothetical protein
MGGWRCSSTILNHDTKWKCMISFTNRSLYPRGEPRNPLNRTLDRHQSRYALYGEKENLLPPPGIELRLLGRPVSILVAVPIELSRIPLVTVQASKMVCRFVSNSVPQVIKVRIWKWSKLAKGFTRLVPEFLSEESRSAVTSFLRSFLSTFKSYNYVSYQRAWAGRIELKAKFGQFSMFTMY